MTDRDLLRAAAESVRVLMRRRQANAMADDPAWVPPDPELMALALEVDDVTFGRRPEADDLRDRLADVLGDDWEPN